MNLILRTGLCFACVLTIAGCAQKPMQKATQTPASQGGASPEPSVFSYEERSKLFGSRPIPANLYRPDVDYRSELRFRVDASAIQGNIKPSRSVLPPLTPEQDQRARLLTPLLDAARQYVEKAAQVSLQIEKAQRSAQKLKPAEESHLQLLIKEQADLGDKVFDPLTKYVSEQAMLLLPDDEDSQVDFIKTKTEAILPEGNLLDMEALGLFIRDEILAAASTAELHKKIAVTQGAVYLRVRATHAEPGQAEAPLHVRPYDKHDEGNVTQEPAVSFRLSDNDRKRLRDDLALAADAAEFVRDVRNSESGLRKDLSDSITLLRGNFQTLKTSLGKLGNIDAVVEKLIDLSTSAAAENSLNEEQRQTITDFRNYLTELKQDVGRLQVFFTNEKIKSYETAGDRQTEVEVLFNAADGISDDLIKNIKNAGRLSTELSRQVKKLGTALRGIETRDSIKPLVEAITSNALEKLEVLAAETLDRYPVLTEKIKSLATSVRLQPSEMVRTLEGLSDDPNLFEMPVENAPDGSMSLARNIRRGLEIVKVEAELITKDVDGQRRVYRELPTQEFSVDKFGLISKWSGNLIFVDRKGAGQPGDPQINFDPTPALGWTLHYAPLTEKTSSGWDKTWKFLNPGAGVSIAALDFEDKGTQIGIGAHLTFFNDLLQVGYGYNLNAISDRRFVFIGIGISEGINQLGGLLGAGAP